MKPYRLLLNILFVSCLLLGSCHCERKEDVKPKEEPQPPQLPPETQEGKRTFGCLVNGEVWLPGGAGMWNLSWSHSFGDDLGVFAVKKYPESGTIHTETVSLAVMNGITGPGIYILNNSISHRARYSSSLIKNCELVTDSLNTGILEITRWDMDRYIVSGRFSFTVAAPGCDTIRVTDGRFDIVM